MSKLTHGHGARRAKALPFIIMLASLAAAPSFARIPSFRWEKIHLRYARPSQLFSSLGLDHTVRYGHTRGDGKPGTDPNFPAGMTDIVPYDADKTIIVRGTPEACARFRRTALAADVAPARPRIEAELVRVRNGQTESMGRQTLRSVAPGALQTLTFPIEGQPRSYQIRFHAETGGAIAIDYQYGKQLPPAPPAPSASETDPTTPAPTVFVPEQIWSEPSRQVARPGESLSFDDLATERQMRAPLLEGIAGASNAAPVFGDDYRLILTMVSSQAPAADFAVPTPTPER